MLVKDLNDIARRNGTSIKQMRNATNRTINQSTVELTAEGIKWYQSAQATCIEIAEGTSYTPEQVAGAIAHLSPRMPWGRNVELARTLVNTGTAPCMKRSLNGAIAALNSDNPIETFGANAHKTRAFFRNIVGDYSHVTVDVWAARIALGTNDAEKMLSRKGMYEAVAHAYKLAGLNHNLTPAETQAVAWCVVRGTHE